MRPCSQCAYPRTRKEMHAARVRGLIASPSLSQVGFNKPGELNMERTNAWVAKLLQEPIPHLCHRDDET